MSRLSEAQARHRAAQHTADWCAAEVAKAARVLRAATEGQAAAEEALETAARELADARRESLGGLT